MSTARPDSLRTTVRVDRATPVTVPQVPALDPDEVQRLVNGEFGAIRYRVLRLLGSGGTAQVFLARDLHIGRDVAIRLVDGGAVSAARELRLAALLEHPHILPVYDAGSDGSLCWLVQRLAPGSDLLTLLEQGTDLGGWQSRTALLVRIAEALAHAHGQGICHHDVKPANILTQSDGAVTLVDWSNATTAAERDAGLCPRFATPAYAPPEQMAGRACDARSDVYALGATAMHVLGGRPPPWPAPPVPRPLRAVLARACSPRPEDRHPDAAALAEDLRAALADRPVSAYRPPVPQRAWRWMRRNPIASMATLLALLATCLGVWAYAELTADRARIWHPDWTLDTSRPLDPNRWTARWYSNWSPYRPLVVPVDAPDALWRIADGALRSQTSVDSAGCSELVLGEILPGDRRINATLVPYGRPWNATIVLGPTRWDGLSLHVGGWRDQNQLVLSGPPHCIAFAQAPLPRPLQVGQPVSITITLIGAEVDVAVDGSPIFHRLPLDLATRSASVHLGVSTGSAALAVRELRQDRLPPPARVQPEAVIDTLLHDRQAQAALAQLRLLEPRPELELRRVRALLQLQRATEAEAVLRDALRHASGSTVQMLRYELVKLLFDRRDWDEALAIASQLADPTVPEPIRSHVWHRLVTTLPSRHGMLPAGMSSHAQQHQRSLALLHELRQADTRFGRRVNALLGDRQQAILLDLARDYCLPELAEYLPPRPVWNAPLPEATPIPWPVHDRRSPAYRGLFDPEIQPLRQEAATDLVAQQTMLALDMLRLLRKPRPRDALAVAMASADLPGPLLAPFRYGLVPSMVLVAGGPAEGRRYLERLLAEIPDYLPVLRQQLAWQLADDADMPLATAWDANPLRIDLELCRLVRIDLHASDLAAGDRFCVETLKNPWLRCHPNMIDYMKWRAAGRPTSEPGVVADSQAKP